MVHLASIVHVRGNLDRTPYSVSFFIGDVLVQGGEHNKHRATTRF